MIKLLILAVVFLVLGLIVDNVDTYMTIEVLGYRIYSSIFSCIGSLFVIILALKLILSPLRLLGLFHKYQQKRREHKKQDLMLQVLLTSLNQEVRYFPELLDKAEHLFGKESYIYWAIKSSLLPDEESYHQLMQFPQTTMAGIRGLFRVADSDGDLQTMRQLLDSLPNKKKKTPWAMRANFQLAVQENDWETALKQIKTMKDILTKDDFIQKKAMCLLLTSNVTDAYKLDPHNPQIVIAYAKANPKKAAKIFRKLWSEYQSWPVLDAYKKHIESIDAKERMRLIKEVVQTNKHAKLSLLAMAEASLAAQEPQKAKKYLDEYLENHPLTKQVALMQAQVERDAWKHEDKAREWENKPVEADDEAMWECDSCGYKSPSWYATCPLCHNFNSLK